MNGPPPTEGTPRASLSRFVPLLFVLALLAYYVAPLWSRYKNTPGTFDGGWTWFMLEVDRTTILEHGQLPLWNAYYCGGAPHFASPQSGTLSPFSILPLLFGTPIGHRLGYTIGLVAALLCLRLYARKLGLSEVASTVAGAGYAMCGAFAQHFGGGHWVWIPFAFFPLMLRSLHLVLEGRKDHLVWGAVPLTLTIFHWPIYPMFYALMLLPIFAVYLGLRGGVRDLRPLRDAVLAAFSMIAIGLAMAAIRMVPTVEYVRAHPRIVKDRDYTWPWELFETYGWRHMERGFGTHQYVFPEFGNYLGIIGLALMFAGAYVVVRRRRALLPIALGALTFCVFQLGNLVPMPWWILRHLPVFDHLRVPSRFTIVAGMFMCILIGVAVDEWGAPALRGAVVGRRARRVGAFVLVLAAVFLVDAVTFNRLQWEQNFAGGPFSLPRAPSFHEAPGNRARMYAYPSANQGSLNCFEETPIPISGALRANLPADEYLREPAAGTVRRVRWSPNRIELDVDLARPATVVVNQNFGPGWHVTGGTIAPADGLLAALVPAGHHAVTFSYLPTSLLVGGAVSLVSVLGAAGFVVVVRRRRRAA